MTVIRTFKRGFVAGLACLCLLVGSTSATFAESSDENAVSTTERVIVGGVSQSHDPTRWDYVPAGDVYGNNGVEIKPMSAWGHQSIPGFDFGFKGLSINVPRGTLAHDIQGGSTYIRKEAAQYLLIASANICNYRIDFQNRDLSGNIKSTRIGNTENTCAWRLSAVREINTPFYVSKGKQCARLFAGGKFRGEQCHNIL